MILLLFACGVMVVAAVVLWLIPYIGFSNIHPRLPLIMAIIFGIVVLYMIGGALTLVCTIVRGKNLFFNRRIRGVVIRFLFPLLIILGKCIGMGKDKVKRSFIAINNQLVLAETKKVLFSYPTVFRIMTVRLELREVWRTVRHAASAG